MSYCRFSDGDVYMYESANGIECCACKLAPLVESIFTQGGDTILGVFEPCDCKGAVCDKCGINDNMTFATKQEAVAHLYAHKDAGHDVPDYAIEELQAEIAAETNPAPAGGE